MAGGLPTLSYLRQRYQYLRGETDYSTANAVNDSHINQAIIDACTLFEFSCNRTTTTGSLSSGAFDLAADYNPTWHLPDARIVVSGVANDSIFSEIPVEDRDQYDTTAFCYWLDWNTGTNRHRFNSNQTTGTVTYTYYFLPTLLVSGTDTCFLSDAEAIAYLAVGKNWVGDERDLTLAQAFTQEGTKRLQALYTKEIAFGARYSEQSLVSRQGQLTGAGTDSGYTIARPY